MSGSYNQPDRSLNWLWLSLIPIFGGLAIAHAGKRTNNPSWVSVGIAFTIISFLLSSQGAIVTIWLAQVGMGLYVRNRILTHPALLGNSEPSSSPLPTLRPGEKIDINTCSKHDLIYALGLPIVYANDIDMVRQEGHIFTHIEELSEIAGLPERYQRTLAPLVTFTYDLHKEIDTSWRRLNHYSAQELMDEGIRSDLAQRIVEEREKNGLYRSAIEVRNRAGIPLKAYQNLL
jgi:DNA uptake protein ComE-like DNA-binding protein